MRTQTVRVDGCYDASVMVPETRREQATLEAAIRDLIPEATIDTDEDAAGDESLHTMPLQWVSMGNQYLRASIVFSGIRLRVEAVLVSDSDSGHASYLWRMADCESSAWCDTGLYLPIHTCQIGGHKR